MAFVVILVTGLGMFFLGLQRGNDATRNSINNRTRASTDVTDPSVATLFFVAEDGMALVAREQDVSSSRADDALTRAHVIVEQQLGPAPPPLVSPFPEGTRLNAIYLTPTGDAFVDLSLEVTREHRGGSLDELFTVYALVNAVTSNVPEVTAVQILIEGREVDTLAGHVDLRHPLERNMKWVSGQPDEPAPAPATAEG